MGKLEELARLTAGNVQDSIGVGRPGGQRRRLRLPPRPLPDGKV